MAQVTYKCLIVDDETLAQELLENHISKIPELTLIGKCHTAIEAMTFLKKEKVDILFLDIEMPDLTGIEFLKSLSNPPLTVFTTAYSEYALEGFELEAIDYLLKPITFNRFFKTATRLLKVLTKHQTTTVQFQPSKKEENRYIFVKSDGKAIKINFDDILYIESLQKYARFFTTKENIVTLMSLTKLEEILPSENFMRIHKSYIANLSKITGIEGNRVHIEAYTATISKTIKPELIKRLDKYNLL